MRFRVEFFDIFTFAVSYWPMLSEFLCRPPPPVIAIFWAFALRCCTYAGLLLMWLEWMLEL